VTYDYIRRTYCVDPRVGQRITMDGRPGVIIRPQGDPAYLRVRFDGQLHASNAHPTWRIDYAPDAMREEASDG
jgi:hypothetical protein